MNEELDLSAAAVKVIHAVKQQYYRRYRKAEVEEQASKIPSAGLEGEGHPRLQAAVLPPVPQGRGRGAASWLGLQWGERRQAAEGGWLVQLGPLGQGTSAGRRQEGG